MRRKHRIDNAVERFSLFRAEESVKEADVVVLVLDPDLGPTVQDKHIAALIQENKKGCVILMNKWDLAMEKGMTQTQAEPLLRKIMPFMSFCPMRFHFGEEGLNVRKSVEVIDAVAGAGPRVNLPTGMLNRTLVEATRRVVAPAKAGKRLRVYYAVQIGVAPVAIRMFVNDPKLATKQYTDFMTRALRERFGLEGAPVVLLYRARTRARARRSRLPKRPAPALRRARRTKIFAGRAVRRRSGLSRSRATCWVSIIARPIARRRREGVCGTG